MKSLGRIAVAAAVVLVSASAARAQATRTWVSGVGDDLNPCSRTAPCKTFAGAISKTAAGGEIDTLDPGGFGVVTITKSLTIDGAGGGLSGVLASGTNGIIVNNTGVTPITVVLRNLSINGTGTVLGINGIRMLNGVAALHVENCVIMHFSQQGIDAEPNLANARLLVTNTSILDVAGAGVLVKPVGGGTLKAALENVRLEQSQVGLRVEDNGAAVLSHSEASNNSNNGVIVTSAGGGADLTVTHSTISNNDNNGIRSVGSASTARIAESTVSRNAIGLIVLSGGAIVSFGNNYITGNTTSDGAPTSTVSPQ